VLTGFLTCPKIADIRNLIDTGTILIINVLSLKEWNANWVSKM